MEKENKSKIRHILSFLGDGLSRVDGEMFWGGLGGITIVIGVLSGIFRTWVPITIWGIVIATVLAIFLFFVAVGAYYEIRDKWSEYKEKHNVSN